MRDSQSIVTEKKHRIKPSIFNPRYYHLRQLFLTTNLIIKKYIAENNFEKLVDFGCGSMPYKELFIPYIKTYIGADIAENKTADLLINENGKLNCQNEIMDILISTQVLEHVQDPFVYLSESHRILKKGGIMILSTHGVWRYHPDPTDYWRWTSSGLSKIITEQGFEVKEVIGIMGLASIGLQLFQDAFLYKFPRFINMIFVPFMQILIGLADKFHSKLNKEKDACVFFVIAYKK